MKHICLLAAGLLLLAVAAVSAHDKPRTCPSATCPIHTEGKQECSKRGCKPVVCKRCEKGQYTPTAFGTSCCTGCKDGIIITAPDNATASCAMCPSGAEPNKTANIPPTTCVCKKGTQATGPDPVTGVANCSLCPAGQYNNASTQAADACRPCPPGTVSPKPGAVGCSPCPPNSTANAAQTACECLGGFYAPPPPPKPSPKPPRRPRMTPAGIVSLSGGPRGTDDGSKAEAAPLVCRACADPAANPDPNTYPLCCADGSTFNATSRACVCAGGAAYNGTNCVCPVGTTWNPASLACECPEGASWDLDNGGCHCGDDGAQWDSVAGQCFCVDGATWVPDSSSCSCGSVTSGAAWNGTACACDATATNGATWDGAGCLCTDGSTTFDSDTTPCP